MSAPASGFVREAEPERAAAQAARAAEEGSSPATLAPPQSARSSAQALTPRAAAALSGPVKATLYAAFNVVAVWSIVVANKLVFVRLRFHFPITLVLVHMLVTLVGLNLAARMGAFERKGSLPRSELLALAMAYVAYNCTSQLNLRVNTVGFYQISKILISPTVLFIERVVYGKTTSSSIKVAILVMCFGIGLSTVHDVDVTAGGLLVASAAVASASVFQIWAGSKQKQLGTSASVPPPPGELCNYTRRRDQISILFYRSIGKSVATGIHSIRNTDG